MLSSVRLPFTHAFITPVLLCSLLGLSAPAYADIQAVASIKPVHSLVSLVMGDKGKASLLIDGAASPHTYALTPQQAREMQRRNCDSYRPERVWQNNHCQNDSWRYRTIRR